MRIEEPRKEKAKEVRRMARVVPIPQRERRRARMLVRKEMAARVRTQVGRVTRVRMMKVAKQLRQRIPRSQSSEHQEKSSLQLAQEAWFFCSLPFNIF